MENSSEGRINPGHKHLKSSKLFLPFVSTFQRRLSEATISLEYLVITQTFKMLIGLLNNRYLLKIKTYQSRL